MCLCVLGVCVRCGVCERCGVSVCVCVRCEGVCVCVCVRGVCERCV